jgi:short-subunit dehydrogenase
MSTVEFAALPATKRPAVVTGASSGIGEASARLLAAIGHPVVLGARRVEVCERIATEIRGAGGTAHAAPLDLEDDASIGAFAKQAVELAGPIEVLVSNAGLVLPGDVLGSDRASLERHLAVNLVGTRALAQILGSAMVERRRGDLVFVGSDVVRAPRPGIASYVTSKYAVEGMVAALGLELEGTGVRVAQVRPGPTLTSMGMDWEPAALGPIWRKWQHFGIQRHANFMAPADVAAAVAAVVAAPPGVVFSTVDVQPLAPIDGRSDAPTKGDG